MRKGFVPYLIRSLAVAALYGLAYTLLRGFSFSQWFLPAGLRLTCLLLVPVRYWPALVVGEVASLGVSSYECGSTYGPAWTVLNMLPPIALAMPVVFWFHRHRAIVTQRGRAIHVNRLLALTLVVSGLWMVLFTGTVYLMRVPPAYDAPGLLPRLTRYFLGNFLGVLTVTPLVLAGLQTFKDQHWTWPKLLGALRTSRPVHEGLGLLLPLTALLCWVAILSVGDFHQVAQIALFVPVVWFSFRHGWKGAAVSGTLSSVAVALTIEQLRDPATMQAQAFIAFAVSSMLLWGAHISLLHRRDEEERLDTLRALELAQEGYIMSEARMRQTADAFESMGRGLLDAHLKLVDRFRHFLSESEEHLHRRESISSNVQVHRLVDGLFPRAWQTRGMLETLREGPIHSLMDDLGIHYGFVPIGDGLDRLSPHLQLAVYRLACETVAYQFARPDRTWVELRLTLRAGTWCGARWVALVLETGSLGNGTPAGERPSMDRRLMLSRLGVCGFGLSSIRNRAGTFRGKVHERLTPVSHRISIFLRDTDALAVMDYSNPIAHEPRTRPDPYRWQATPPRPSSGPLPH